jgi:hypothetical protein
MLWNVISEFAKPFPENTDRITPPEKVKCMRYDQIEAVLRLGAPKLAWLKKISPEHLDGNRQWGESDSVGILATYPVARRTG